MKIEEQSREISWAQELIRQSWSYRAARVLQVACTLNLFTRLGEEGATAAQIAADEGWDADRIENLLIACAAMELVMRDGKGWKLTAKGAATMLPAAPLYQGNAIAHSTDVWNFWDGLELTVRGEERGAAGGEGEVRRHSHRHFILAMHDMAMAGRAARLAACVDLNNRRRIVDVGGGPGTYTIALCQRNPQLRGTIFDLPETIALAREVIDRFSMTDRISTVEGSWDEDEFGEEVDAILMSNVLHGSGSGAGMKLAKAHRALVDGGLLILQDFLLNAEKTGQLNPALFNIMVGAYSTDELCDVVREAGFSDLRLQPMPEDLGTSLLTAVK